jgi:hypothetical protein
MKIKLFFLVSVFTASCNLIWGQNLEDIFDMGTEKPNPKKHEEVILDVDQNVSSNKPTDQEVNAKQDSLLLLFEKWKNYFSGVNANMKLQLELISLLEPEKVKNDELKKYRRELDDFKEEVTNYLNNNSDISWKSNDVLVELNVLFFKNYRAASAKLEDIAEKNKKDPMKKYIALGASLMGLMVLVPIFMQVKAGISAKKMKKQQEKIMKKQKADLEKQQLLANENDMIIIKE